MPRRTESWHADPEKLYGKQELRQIIERAIRGGAVNLPVLDVTALAVNLLVSPLRTLF